MHTLVDYILANKEWIFSGIGAAILSAFIWWVRQTKGEKSHQEQHGGNMSINIQAGRDIQVSGRELSKDDGQADSKER